MERTRFIEHKGKKIVFMDFSGVKDIEEGLGHIKDAIAFVAQQEKNSLRTLVDVKDSAFDRRITAALKDLSAHNKPYVFANATVGVSGLQRMLVKTVARLSGRKLNIFDSRQQALDWLAEQAPGEKEAAPEG